MILVDSCLICECVYFLYIFILRRTALLLSSLLQSVFGEKKNEQGQGGGCGFWSNRNK